MSAQAGRSASDSRFLLEAFEPAYRGFLERENPENRLRQAIAELAECRACPRDCRVDRTAGKTAACFTGRYARVASAFPHFGEEDCLRGRRGSGTIFFGACNLRCVFCQNWDISQRPTGEELAAVEIAELMLELQGRGCHNINFVTPEHVAPQVVEAIIEAARRGLRIPIVYNTSAYDSACSLALLDGLIDIYMPDFKFWRPETAKRLALAADYPDRAREAIREMHRQVGVLQLGADGVARRGLLIRHLVMPGQLDESAAIFEWLAKELSPDTYINVMGQYRPAHEVGEEGPDGRLRFPEIANRLDAGALDLALAAARKAGLWRLA